MNQQSKIYVAGHRGMVGSAICRTLAAAGFNNVIGKPSSELDLRNQQAVNLFFEAEKPEIVFIAAAKVGGIHANDTLRAEFIYDNLMIAANVIHAAYVHGVEKLMFLGSSCMYPKNAAMPLVEGDLLSGSLEPTNEPYAIAKIAGVKLCESYRQQYGCNFISVIPCNLYGIGDNYHLRHSHVIPALIRKFHEAKAEGKPAVNLWGTGNPEREFLFADDLAEACVFLMERYDGLTPINVGSGEHVSIRELADTIQNIVGYEGEIHWDSSMHDGMPMKWMDVSKLNQLGWRFKTSLEVGLRISYQDFLAHQNEYAA